MSEVHNDGGKGSGKPDYDLYRCYIDERNRLIGSKQESTRSFDQTILSFSAGAIALSITFLEKIAPEPTGHWILFLSWVGFTVALGLVLYSFRTSQRAFQNEINALDRSYQEGEAQLEVDNPATRKTDRLNTAASVAFFLAIALFALFAGVNWMGKETADDRQQKTQTELWDGVSRGEAGRDDAGSTGTANQPPATTGGQAEITEREVTHE